MALIRDAAVGAYRRIAPARVKGHCPAPGGITCSEYGRRYGLARGLRRAASHTRGGWPMMLASIATAGMLGASEGPANANCPENGPATCNAPPSSSQGG